MTAEYPGKEVVGYLAERWQMDWDRPMQAAQLLEQSFKKFPPNPPIVAAFERVVKAVFPEDRESPLAILDEYISVQNVSFFIDYYFNLSSTEKQLAGQIGISQEAIGERLARVVNRLSQLVDDFPRDDLERIQRFKSQITIGLAKKDDWKAAETRDNLLQNLEKARDIRRTKREE